MTSSAHAAVATEPLTMEHRVFAVPDVAVDDGWLEVEACGICGTDWDYYSRSIGADLGPLVLGHEVVGRVGEIGPEAADRWQVTSGDRVVVQEFLPCGACKLCRQGDGRLCAATDSRRDGPFLRYGATSTTRQPRLWGGFAEVMYLHPRSLVHRVDPSVSSELATLYVPLSNGLAWAAMGKRAASRVAVVIGPGQHGLATAIAARRAGWERVVVAGLGSDTPRLEMATAIGADRAVNVDVESLNGVVMDVSDGVGAGLVVDLTPKAPSVVTDAIDLAGMGATVILAGSKGGAITQLQSDRIVRGELTVRGVRGRPSWAVEQALSLLRDEPTAIMPLATHTVGLGAVGEALHQHGEEDQADIIHVAVQP